MESKLTSLFLISILLVGIRAQGQNVRTFTEADYDHEAAMLSGNVSKLIDNDILPQWLPDGRLWYRASTEFEVEYKLFDPAGGKQIVADSKTDLFEKGATFKISMP